VLNAEPAFYALNLLVIYFGLGIKSLFFLFYSLKCMLYFVVIKKVFKASSARLLLVTGILVAFQSFSTWHYVLTVDAIKQGLAVPLIISAYYEFYSKNFCRAFFYGVLSILMHYASILLIIFVPLMLLNRKILIVLLSISVSLYVSQANSWVISLFSEVTTIPLHDAIDSYAKDSGRYSGFNFLFFLYSVILIFFFGIASFIITPEYKKAYSFFLRTSLIFMIFFFLFAFGNFTNRYAFYFWAMSPFFGVLVVLGYLYRFYFMERYCILFLLFSSSIIYSAYRMAY
jgi:hypothetical protein